MADVMRLYHTGFAVIPSPDLLRGRKNADFGQGFYLTDDVAFSRRWARQRSCEVTYLNSYELDYRGLRVKTFDRDEAWFDYIFRNRRGETDALAGYDVIMGPIANDTIYDTWGIITSGFLPREQALRLLSIGPEYRQIVVKSPAAAARLRFLGAEALTAEAIARYRETVAREERQFQSAFAALLAEMNQD